MRRALLMALGLGATVFLSAGVARAKTLEAVASISIIGDMVKHVGGDRVHVTTFVGPGGDPHGFEPSPKHGKTLKAADIAFVNGLGLDGWMESLAKASGYAGKIVATSDGIRTRQMEEDGKDVTDPHAWNSAANGVIYVQNIVKGLSVADPEGAATYEANGKKYAEELQKLDDYAKQEIGSIPQAQRKVVTNHDALGYFGDAYGVQFLAVEGLSTEAEPSAKAIANLIEKIKMEKVKVYFVESSNDSRLVKQVAKATGAESGGELYVESLSKPNGPAGTYTAMFKHNVDLLVAAMKKNEA